MSAIAEFTRLPAALVEQLPENYDQIIQRHGQQAASYAWSGYVLATLLPYLEERGIKLMDSPYDALTMPLCESRGATICIFTSAHKDAYLSQLSPEQFSADEMGAFFNEFNAANEAGVGEAMMDGVAAIRESLASLDADSVIVLEIG